ncbi:MAG: ABC transporter permease [Bacteroidales bacterium]|jgi:putative ABC transport system permease protein|nr:ABC transporter permease [Bacteroidales bacterium]
MYAFKTLANQYVRFIITAIGIALCLMLMLFLLAIYYGVSDASVRYVRESEADIWILQRHAANLLRGTSLLSTRHGEIIKQVDGVRSIAPILFFTATVNVPDNTASMHLVGYDPSTGKGGPPEMVAGDTLQNDDQIILDYTFAAKYKLKVGDKLPIRDDTLTVAGLCDGTNLFVIQFAFITLNKARQLLGFQSILSCYQVMVNSGSDPLAVAAKIRSVSPDLAVYDKVTFLNNNIHEAETGVMPLLYVVALIGAVVLTALLSLILSVYVLEQQKDYAIMKALGAPTKFIPGIVIEQALMLAASGLIIALLLFNPMLNAVKRFSPTISAESSFSQVLLVAAGLIIISFLSTILPLLRQRRIYPLDVFR